jgi:putative selenium metabolism protein SsnA
MIIHNARIIKGSSPNVILDGYTIEIRNGSIVSILPDAEFRSNIEFDEIFDARGQYVLPGSICAHTHFYGAYARGMSIPGEPARDFPEILKKLWWPLDKALDEKSIRYSAQVCLLDAIKHGTTTLFDHHASQNHITGSLDIIAEQILNSGVRAALCYEVTDRDGQEKTTAGIAENIRFYDSLRNQSSKKENRLASFFGLHAGLTLSDDTLKRVVESSPEEIGFHIHVAEHSSDQENSQYNHGLRVVNRLSKFKILRRNSIIVHGVHLNDEEINLLAEKGCWVTHQPRSNMNNGVGMARVEEMLQAGIRVCLGNDGFSNLMWEEWKAAYLAHKLWHKDPRRMPADLIYRMAVINNAALATETFNAPIGTISEGSKADLILVDHHPYTPLTTGNLPWQIIFGFNEGMITATMANGRFLMRDGEILTLDEEKITSEALGYAPRVWSKYNQIVQG